MRVACFGPLQWSDVDRFECAGRLAHLSVECCTFFRRRPPCNRNTVTISGFPVSSQTEDTIEKQVVVERHETMVCVGASAEPLHKLFERSPFDFPSDVPKHTIDRETEPPFLARILHSGSFEHDLEVLWSPGSHRRCEFTP